MDQIKLGIKMHEQEPDPALQKGTDDTFCGGSDVRHADRITGNRALCGNGAICNWKFVETVRLTLLFSVDIILQTLKSVELFLLALQRQ